MTLLPLVTALHSHSSNNFQVVIITPDMLPYASLEYGILSYIKMVLYESDYAVGLAVLIENLHLVSQQIEI